MLVYNDENRLVSVTYPGESGSVTDTYEYNALGQRMRAVLDGTAWRYIYNGDPSASLRAGRVLQELDDAGVEQARHLTESGSYYDPWLGMKRVENSVHFFPLYDGVGHVRKLTTPGGGGAGSYTYGAFGRYLFGSGSTTNPYKYGGAWGYITDPSGLLQLGARFYWPEVGRFVQQDILSYGPNRYSYGLDNPLRYIDPEGLAGLTLAAFAGLGGAITIGWDPCSGPFITFSAGAGSGAGLAFDPFARSPGYQAGVRGHGSFAGLGAAGFYGRGPALLGVQWARGKAWDSVGNEYQFGGTEPAAMLGYGVNPYSGAPQWQGWGFGGAWWAGVQGGFF